MAVGGAGRRGDARVMWNTHSLGNGAFCFFVTFWLSRAVLVWILDIHGLAAFGPATGLALLAGVIGAVTTPIPSPPDAPDPTADAPTDS
jgi:hypothetical protein